jgi:hypothetical protein
MLPLRDNIPPRTFPFVNYLLIAATSLAFISQLADNRDGQDHLVERFGMIPLRVFHPNEPILVRETLVVQTPFGRFPEERTRQLDPSAVPAWLTLLTCVFLHGGWMHFLGNMWFLHIFGDNVEDRIGHFGYLIFYLGSGVAASMAHLATNADSTVPTIGASGAIAGVMGAYMLFYPRANVVTLVPLFLFMEVLVIPAPVFLGIWFVMQLFSGVATITATQVGGVAWWAHIGGFAAGFAVAWLLSATRRARPKVEVILPNTDRITHYRYRRMPPRRDVFDL